jgi:hypothetical protein
MSRVLVCGGRHFSKFKLVCKALDEIHGNTPITCLISGGCSGADSLAKDWADARCISAAIFKADWAIGPSAGPIRNQRMLDEGRPDLVVAFPGGRGTADMVRRANGANVPVLEIDESGAVKQNGAGVVSSAA